MRMAVIGTGYVGTVTGACMAELGHEVICADTGEEHIERLGRGELDFYEEGLESLIRSNLKMGRLSFTTHNREAVQDAEVVFLCVGAKGALTEKPDMTPLIQAAKDIAASMKGKGYKLIVDKSTLPVKTGEYLKDLIKQELPPGSTFEYDVAAVPEFLREGTAVYDFFHPDRLVIGVESNRAKEVLMGIYSEIDTPIVITDINSAELIKYATNAFLAMKISFINSIAQICEKTGADITMVSKGLGMDKRIAPNNLNAGIGYGGIFLPRDINALLSIAEQYHINLDLLKDVETVNRYQRIHFIERIEKTLGTLHGKTIAVWGLAFRPNTDDLRDAPSITIIRGLMQRGATIRTYDPLAMEKTRGILPKITYCNDPYEAATDADAVAILTEWPVFSNIDLEQLKAVSKCRTVIDGRNLFTPRRMAENGFRYISIGRKPTHVPSLVVQ